DPELALTDTPTGRLLTESELGATVAWLLSEEADQINGEVLRLDGGYSITGGSRRDPRRD
ncbi:MAG: SDR family oxidoreductase, partial [Solirubrobacterales bacterium]|nr:SDR family oxidoreductase [Solirubrobacterales bacterium]